MSVMPWCILKDEVDRFGPVKSSVNIMLAMTSVNRNPVESWFVARFASEPEASLPLLKSLVRNSSRKPVSLNPD